MIRSAASKRRKPLKWKTSRTIGSQPVPRPDDHSEAAHQQAYLLGFKAFFTSLGHAQSLLVALEGGFDAALIIEADIGQQHCYWIIKQREGLTGQNEDVLVRQSGDQQPASPSRTGAPADGDQSTSLGRSGPDVWPACLSRLCSEPSIRERAAN